MHPRGLFLCWSLNASREVEYARVDPAPQDTRDLAGWQQLSGCAEALWHLLASLHSTQQAQMCAITMAVLMKTVCSGLSAPWIVLRAYLLLSEAAASSPT